MATFPSAPASEAGGAIVLNYTQAGTNLHRIRVHIPPFGNAPEASASVANTVTDWAYNTVDPGHEASVAETVINLIDKIKVFYPSEAVGASQAGLFTLRRLYRFQTVTVNGVPRIVRVRVLPLPAIGQEVGTGTVPYAGNGENMVVSYYTLPTIPDPLNTLGEPRHFQLRLTNVPNRFQSGIFRSVGGAGQGIDTNDWPLVEYLARLAPGQSGNLSQLVGHDGQPPTAPANLKTGVPRRLWRKVTGGEPS